MTKVELLQLLAQLYGGIASVSDYSSPERLPAVHLIPRAIVQDLVCEKPCQIRAFYHPDFGLIIDDSLALNSSLHDRSILLHELVHHAQHLADKFADIPDACQRRAASEMEAYQLQNRYLAAQGASGPIPTIRWDRFCNAEKDRESEPVTPADLVRGTSAAGARAESRE